MEKVLCFLLIASLAPAYGFHTQKCNQNLLEIRTMGMIKCLQSRWKEVEHLFKPSNAQNLEKNPFGCDFIDKNIACWNNHLGSCFIDDFKKDMATLLDASYENQAYVSCHRNGARRTNQLKLVQTRLTQKYAQYKFQPEKLNDIIQLENPCSSQRFMSSIERGGQCFMSKAQSQMFDVQMAMYSSRSNDVTLPVCDLLTIGLDCFKLKECFNDQESQFLANLIVTLYKMVMEELDRALTMFPGDKMYDYLTKNDVGMSDAKTAVTMFKGMVKDSKTTSCQTKLKKWKDCTKDCTYQSDKPFIAIGCWKDDLPRAIPALEGNAVLDMHYKQRSNSITKCFKLASSLGFDVFAIQDGGQCMTSSSAEKSFDKYGTSTECSSSGRGGPMANDVYWIKNFGKSASDASEDAPSSNVIPLASARKSAPATFVSLGCWKDDLPRVIQNSTLELEGHYKRRSNPVEKCFQAALSKGFSVFAVQDGGQCFSSNTAKKTYKNYGKSSKCLGSGTGGPMANDVYRIIFPI